MYGDTFFPDINYGKMHLLSFPCNFCLLDSITFLTVSLLSWNLGNKKNNRACALFLLHDFFFLIDLLSHCLKPT